MCKPGDHFILCTCESSDEKIYDENHWTIARSNKFKDENVLGLWEGPYYHDSFDATYEWLLQQLNDRNCFDKDLKFSNKDLLGIFIKPDIEKPFMDFGFVYKKGKWLKHSYDPFSWENGHDEKEKGIIKWNNQVL